MPVALDKHPVQSQNIAALQTLAPILIAAFAFVLYLGTFRFEFVYDDVMQVVNNPLILSWHNLPWLFKTDVWRFSNPLLVGNYWRPLFMVWLLFNHWLFGFNPAGWHITSALLHAVTTYFCFRLVNRLSGDTLISTVAALIFAVHPCHLETVAWVSGATDSLMALFYVTAVSAFVLGWEKPTASRWRWFLLSAVLFGMSLLSKETAATLPLLVVGYVLLFGKREVANWSDVARRVAIPLAIFGLVFLLYWMGRNHALAGVTHSRVQIGLTPLLMTWPWLLLFYVKHLVWPVGLSVFYGSSIVIHATWSRLWLPLIVDFLLFGLAITWMVRARNKLVALAHLLLLVPLAPAFVFPAIFPVDFAHDRYLYLPCLGFAILVGIALREAADRFRSNWVPVTTTTVIVLLLSAASASQLVYWANNVLLFDRATRMAPSFLPGYNALGEALATRGRMKEAMFVMQQVVKADPQNTQALFNLGLGSFLDGNYAQAEEYLSRTASLNALDGDTFALLAESRVRLGRYAEAESDIRKAIQVKPYKPGYRRVLALSLEGQGKTAEATAAAEDELRVNPGDAETQQLIARLKASRERSKSDKKEPL
jgi:protein O-mannosyl-transferase